MQMQHGELSQSLSNNQDGLQVENRNQNEEEKSEHTRSNAVEHARGCVATKIGLVDMMKMTKMR